MRDNAEAWRWAPEVCTPRSPEVVTVTLALAVSTDPTWMKWTADGMRPVESCGTAEFTARGGSMLERCAAGADADAADGAARSAASAKRRVMEWRRMVLSKRIGCCTSSEDGSARLSQGEPGAGTTAADGTILLLRGPREGAHLDHAAATTERPR